jgi:hypothetical protein
MQVCKLEIKTFSALSQIKKRTRSSIRIRKAGKKKKESWRIKKSLKTLRASS